MPGKKIVGVRNMLILSTEHVCQSTHDMLEAESLLDSGTRGLPPGQRPRAAISLTVGRFGDFAWFLWVPHDGHDSYPADLEMIFAYARQIDCDYLLLDVEQDPIPDLPVYPKE